VQIVDAQDQGGGSSKNGSGSGTIPAVRNRKKLLLVIMYSAAIAGAAIGGYFIYHELNESPSRPRTQ